MRPWTGTGLPCWKRRTRESTRRADQIWLRRICEVTWEGPFGQAHWAGTTDAERQQASARKASFFNGNCYLEACGCSLATTLLEDVAGLAPRSPA